VQSIDGRGSIVQFVALQFSIGAGELELHIGRYKFVFLKYFFLSFAD